MKINFTDNQLKILAELAEKIGLALGTTVLINSFILDKPTVSVLNIYVFGIFSVIFLAVSVQMRK